MGQALSGGTHISLYWIWPWISFRALLRFLNNQAPGDGLEGRGELKMAFLGFWTFLALPWTPWN